MSPDEVCAVIYGTPPGPAVAEVRRALAVQSRPPGGVLTGSSLTAAVRAGRAGGAAWIWLLDGWAVPEPDALAELLAVVETISPPRPLLLSGKVVDEHGDMHPDATPRHEVFEKENSLRAAEHCLVQLRAAGPGSILVSSAAVARFGLPRPHLPPDLGLQQWSARILRSRDDTGYLVPSSRAVRRAGADVRGWRHRAAQVRVVASDAWTLQEKLWESFLLGEDLFRAIRNPGASRALGSGNPGSQAVPQPPEHNGGGVRREAVETQVGEDRRQ